MHRMKLVSNGKLEKYSKWEWNYKNFDVSTLNFPTGVGGILYPPHCFNNEVFNDSVYLTICKSADDVWFKAMALMKGYLSQKVYTHNIQGEDFITNDKVQDIALANINIGKSMNDFQIKTVFDKYNLYKQLK
jgi:hypothetical protein